MIDCSSTAYLALDRDPTFREWVREGFERFGTHYGGSRHAPGAPPVYAEAESLLADWLQAEDAILVSSGSLAATWVRRHYSGPGWVPHFGPVVHAAWHPPTAAEDDPARTPGGTPVWFADSFDPIAVATPDWPALLATAGPADHWVLDESHTIGLLGAGGAGLAPAYRSRLAGPLLAVGSLGKALSLPAGFIAGDGAVLSALRQSARFGGAAPPNPAFVYAFTRAGALVDRQRSALRTRLDYFLRRLPPGFPLRSVPGHPALRCLDSDFYAFAQRNGIRLSHFAYPTPAAEPVTRIVLNAGLSFPALNRLLNVIHRFTNS